MGLYDLLKRHTKRNEKGQYAKAPPSITALYDAATKRLADCLVQLDETKDMAERLRLINQAVIHHNERKMLDDVITYENAKKGMGGT